MDENKNNQEIMVDDFEVASEEDNKMLEDTLSEIENLTDEELKNIAGGESENAEISKMNYRAFRMIAAMVLKEIRAGNKPRAIELMRIISSYDRSNSIYINLREEFKKKFNEDPGNYGL